MSEVIDVIVPAPTAPVDIVIPGGQTTLGAAQLLIGEEGLLSADFTYADPTQMVSQKGDGDLILSAPGDYFANGNSVPKLVQRADGNWVQAAGGSLALDWRTSDGESALHISGAAANLCHYPRDLTQGVWTKSNIVATRDATGVKGDANGATRLSATADNAIISQQITSASAERVAAAFVRRISGVGPVYFGQGVIGANVVAGFTAAADWTWDGTTLSGLGTAGGTVAVGPPTVAGKRYRITYTKTGVSGLFQVRLGLNFVTTDGGAGTASRSFDVIAGSSNSAGLGFTSSAAFLGTITDIEVKEIVESQLSLNDTLRRFALPAATLADPIIGFRLATSGDEIAIDYVQAEVGPAPTAVIDAVETAGVMAARNADTISALLPTLMPLGDAYTIYFDFECSDVISDIQYIFSLAHGIGELVSLRVGNGRPLVAVVDNSIEQGTFQAPDITALQRHQVTIRVQTNMMAISVDGKPIGSGQLMTATAPTPDRIYLGSFAGSVTVKGELWIRRLVILPQAVDSFHLATRFVAVATDPTPYKVCINSAQSNGAGAGQPLDPMVDVSNGHVYQMDQEGAISLANEPLKGPFVIANSIGHTLALCNALQAALGGEWLIESSAIGNTGFPRHGPGGDIHERELSMAGVTRARFPNAVFILVDWQLGEFNADEGWTKQQFIDASIAKFANLRSRIGNAAVIAGEMAYTWVDDEVERQPVQDALSTIADWLDNSACTSASELNAILAHFDAVSQREVGVLKAAAYLALVA